MLKMMFEVDSFALARVCLGARHLLHAAIERALRLEETWNVSKGFYAFYTKLCPYIKRFIGAIGSKECS